MLDAYIIVISIILLLASDDKGLRQNLILSTEFSVSILFALFYVRYQESIDGPGSYQYLILFTISFVTFKILALYSPHKGLKLATLAAMVISACMFVSMYAYEAYWCNIVLSTEMYGNTMIVVSLYYLYAMFKSGAFNRILYRSYNVLCDTVRNLLRSRILSNGNRT